MKNIFYNALLFVLGTNLTACANQITELQRATNASKSLDAVVAVKETDATVATPTEIFVVPSGQKAKDNPVFRADNIEGLVVSWENESNLIIRAKKARVFLDRETVVIDIPGSGKEAISVNLQIMERR